MSVGGTIVDIVEVSPNKWWVNTIDGNTLWEGHTVAVYCDPNGKRLQVGDGFWWQGQFCYWTPRQRPDGRQNVKIRKIGYSGVSHPDSPKKLWVEKKESPPS